ncbi:replication initiator [Streptomyces sp. M41]|uniref:replication initiator n=1 Tax=Streptomyces sp. M41 TaxID=3059412 RepID=UPI00374CF0C1
MAAELERAPEPSEDPPRPGECPPAGSDGGLLAPGRPTRIGGIRLRAWAHTLGYRGPVLTKSTQYSTAYGALSQVRADHQNGGGLLALEDRDTVTESAWRYVGSGHSPAESDFAVGITEDLAALREIRRDMIAEGWRYASQGKCRTGNPRQEAWGLEWEGSSIDEWVQAQLANAPEPGPMQRQTLAAILGLDSED